jgi:hypothetical protein
MNGWYLRSSLPWLCTLTGSVAQGPRIRAAEACAIAHSLTALIVPSRPALPRRVQSRGLVPVRVQSKGRSRKDVE